MGKIQRLILNHKNGTSEFTLKDENAVAFDEDQREAKKEEQRKQARANIGAASAEEVGNIETALDSIIAIQEELLGIITFAVGGTSYKAESGMTWEEWCNSEYNVNGFYFEDDVVYTADGDYIALHEQDSQFITVTDSIIAGHTYWIM